MNFRPLKALSLHAAWIDTDVFEQACELSERRAGFNLLPHTTKAPASLGLLPAFGHVGIETSGLIYATRRGQIVCRERRQLGYGKNSTAQLAPATR